GQGEDEDEGPELAQPPGAPGVDETSRHQVGHRVDEPDDEEHRADDGGADPHDVGVVEDEEHPGHREREVVGEVAGRIREVVADGQWFGSGAGGGRRSGGDGGHGLSSLGSESGREGGQRAAPSASMMAAVAWSTGMREVLMTRSYASGWRGSQP